MNSSADVSPSAWPALPLDAWRDTYAALHLRTQIVGKIRLSLSPWVNHSWHTTLYAAQLWRSSRNRLRHFITG